MLFLFHVLFLKFHPYSKIYFNPMYAVQAEQKTNLLLRLEEAIPPEVMGFGMGEFDVSI